MRVLLVVDLQKEFAVEPYHSKVVDFIKTHKSDYDKVIATRFINTKDSPFVNKLGFNEAMKRHDLDIPYDELFGKHTYECGNGFYKHMKADDVYVIGCDTDACILSMCFEMFRLNVNFKVLSEYCYSSGGEEYHNAALTIMRRNFGTDAVV